MPRKKKYGRTPTSLFGSYVNDKRKAFDFTMNRMYDMLEEHTYYQEKTKFQAKILSGGTTGGTKPTEPSAGRVVPTDSGNIALSYKIRFIEEDEAYNLHENPLDYPAGTQREILLSLQQNAIHETPASQSFVLPYDTIVNVEKIDTTYFITKVIKYPDGFRTDSNLPPDLLRTLFKPPNTGTVIGALPTTGNVAGDSGVYAASKFGGNHSMEKLEKRVKKSKSPVIGVGAPLAAQQAMVEINWWSARNERDVGSIFEDTLDKNHIIFKRIQLYSYYGKQDRKRLKGEDYRKLEEYFPTFQTDDEVSKVYIASKSYCGKGTGDCTTGIEHWSATSISWVMRGTEFPSRVGHSYYSEAVRQMWQSNVKGKGKGWGIFSLIRDKIKPKLGDVCVKAGNHGKNYTKLTASHGDVIYKIDGSFAYLAGGNLGPRGQFKHAYKMPLDSQGFIDTKAIMQEIASKTSKNKYLIILKKMKLDVAEENNE